MIPEDLTGMSDEELQALADDLKAQAEGLAADAATDDAALSQLEALVADMEKIQMELSGREAAASERAARAAAALEKLTGGAPEAEEAEEDIEVVAEAATEEVVEAAAETIDEQPADEQPAEVQVTEVVEFSAEDEQPAEADEVASDDGEAEIAEAAIEDEAVVETAVEEQVVEASADTIEEAEAPAEADSQDTSEFTSEVTVNDNIPSDAGTEALSRLVPDGVAPQSEQQMPTGAALLASNSVPGVMEGTSLSTAELANAIAKKRHGMNNGYERTGSYERIIMATASADMPNKVSGTAEENFAVFDTVRKQWAAERGQQTALVASGGNCAPLEPSYNFFRLAEPLNPVESALPTVEAPRGGIRFITPPDWRDAFAGVRVTTEAEDAAGYGPGYTDPKPCVHVDCPPVEECRVDAVSQCVEFGNLNYRVFPEQVEAFLQDLAVAFTQTKEVFYLDAIDGASTAVTASPAYGAARGTTQTILAAAANYRRRQHMPINATLTLMLPSWMVEFIKVDLVNDHSLGLNFLTAGEAEVNAWLASANLDVAWYYDSATGAGQAFADLQGAGAINPFPTSVVGYLFAPGTFVRLDGGTLDVGIVRDSTLNGTNDLQIFSEQWVQVCQVGLESLRLEITLCPDGTGPEPVTPLTCGA